MSAVRAIRRSLGLLSRRDRRLLILATLAQMATAVLDLAGVLLLGLVGALAVTVVQSQPPPTLVQEVADSLGLGELSSDSLVLVLAVSAAILFLVKSLLAVLISRRTLKFLANRQALVTERLASRLLHMPLTFLQRRSSQETAFALIQGSGAATVQLLAQAVVALTELTLLTLLGASLFLVDPWVTVGAVAFFALVALGIHRSAGPRAGRAASELASLDIEGMNAVQEGLRAYREAFVARRRRYYVEAIQQARWRAAEHIADLQFISLFPKYLLELALVTGGVALAAVLFASQSAVVAVGTLTLFLAAGSRVMPSILRFQVAVIGIRNAAGTAEVTFLLAEDMVGVGPVAREDPLPSLSTVHPGFAGEVLVQGISYAYPGTSACALAEVTFQVPEGQSVAIVGPSGAGKSTLADVLLGLLDPDSGRISISGLDVNDALSQWPGAVAYVPQTVFIAQATLRQNVALGLPWGAVTESQILDALARAQLDDFVSMLPQGLDEPMGENGFRLSGGQRQRIGIARALLSHPKLILLDEATSALDAETEAAIGETLRSLRGNVTAIVIAHRLSTVKDCDQVIYMDKGRVLAKGIFAEVVAAVPALGRQASLMGLADEFPSVGG